MKFCQNVLNNAKDILLQKKMKHLHTILIGENASGKSEVIRGTVEEMLSQGKRGSSSECVE